jgi:membrane protein DedA with SNARE-associated domain
MLAALEVVIIPFLENLYRTMGYAGVALAMAIESACIPLPSELIMPMAGWMVSRGEFSLLPVALVGAIGNLLGSILAYWVGAIGGRPFLMRYGKYFLISEHDIEVADRWFMKYGEATAFFSRLLPVVRTFISLPAGISRMNFPRFCLYTVLGSFPWSLLLAFAGLQAGDHWIEVRHVLEKADYPIGIIILAAVAYYVYRHVRRAQTPWHSGQPSPRPDEG